MSGTQRDFQGEVTVVIPTRNRMNCLRRVFPTYLQPGVSRVLIVDDASEPAVDYAELHRLAGLLPVRAERLDRRHGQPGARNVATSHAETDWLLFSDDDVFLDPGYVEALMAAQVQTGADIVAGSRIYLVDGEDAETARERCAAMTGEPFDRRYLMANFSALMPENREVLHLQTTALIRRSLAAEIRWDEGFPPPSYREETDFYLRAAASGARLVWARDAVCFHLAPADTAVGGQRTRHWWTYELGAIKCNHRFMGRHYEFLRQHQAIDGPRWLAELRFNRWRLQGGFLRDAYQRYLRSGIRPLVQRVRGRTCAG